MQEPLPENAGVKPGRHTVRLEIFSLAAPDFPGELRTILFRLSCALFREQMAEYPAVTRTEEPDLHAEGEDPVDRHPGDEGLKKLTEGPAKLYPVDYIGAAAHNGAHQQYGEAGADSLLYGQVTLGFGSSTVLA